MFANVRFVQEQEQGMKQAAKTRGIARRPHQDRPFGPRSLRSRLVPGVDDPRVGGRAKA